MEQIENFNPQSIIDEWNAKTEHEQYEALLKCVMYNLKYSKNSFIFTRDDIDEAVSLTWLYLQPKLTVEYIERENDSFLKRKGKNICLSVIVCRAANVARVTLARAKRKNTDTKLISLETVMHNRSDSDLKTLIENIPLKSESVESIVVNRLALEHLKDKCSGQKSTILNGLLNEYTQSEIARSIRYSRQYINQCVKEIRQSHRVYNAIN